MKTIKLTAATCDLKESAAPAAASTDVHSTQSQAGFWRRKRVTKYGTVLESSTGGSVFVADSDLWTLAESHDVNLCVPKPVLVAPQVVKSAAASVPQK